MSFEKKFCPSPWFHMRINNSGTYEYCRWAKHDPNTVVNQQHSIKFQTPTEYFQNNLSQIRYDLLSGISPTGCNECHNMESHKKISGRQRQLLKIGVLEPWFEKSLASSPLRNDFDYSLQHQGLTKRNISDWQIDLGNYCNGACIFCSPEYSSRLATEFQQLGLIQTVPTSSWCDDPALLEKFISELITNTNLKYLHFIGGETLITPGFKKILQALVDSGQSNTISIGFTTNLTVWSESINQLLEQFEGIHLGMSVETLTPINDYVRWPSELSDTKNLLDRWVKFGKQHNWSMQLRVTPTCLTIHDLNTVYDYAWENYLSVESCNFLYKPDFMRIDVLPVNYLTKAKNKLQEWINQHNVDSKSLIINTRDPNVARLQLIQDAQSYVNYIELAQDNSLKLPKLIQYLKTLENNRGNNILTYLPEYEELFRSVGY